MNLYSLNGLRTIPYAKTIPTSSNQAAGSLRTQLGDSIPSINWGLCLQGAKGEPQHRNALPGGLEANHKGTEQSKRCNA